MKTIFFLCLLSFAFAGLKAQKSTRRPKQLSIALFNTAPSKPFEEFAGLFTENIHPGIELGYGITWSEKKKHDWYQQVKTSYFYHRFVQHGISLYTDFGYRYKFNRRFNIDMALGAGYMQSIPATAVLKLNKNGEYEEAKGMGRAQFITPFTMGTGYTVNPSAKRPVKLFAQYQQKIQFPFISEYVPLLPYCSFILGASIRIK
jgi:hypothetical protein